MFREKYLSLDYDDAPYLSDQLLLPALAAGDNVHLVAAFTPSYVFGLGRDLASSPEIEPGKLNLVLCIPMPSDLSVDTERLFARYLSVYSENSSSTKQFAKDALQLLGEKSLQLTCLYAQESLHITKSCLGIIESTKGFRPDYVGFVDAKGGDWNSPIHLQRSWIQGESENAEALVRVTRQGNQAELPGMKRIDSARVASWLRNIVEGNHDEDLAFYSGLLNRDDSEPLSRVIASRSRDSFDDLLVNLNPRDGHSLLSYLEDCGAVILSDALIHAELVEVNGREHIPPLPAAVARYVGEDEAICPCGTPFYRVSGCDSVAWDNVL